MQTLRFAPLLMSSEISLLNNSLKTYENQSDLLNLDLINIQTLFSKIQNDWF